jgi:hypothetical protein
MMLHKSELCFRCANAKPMKTMTILLVGCGLLMAACGDSGTGDGGGDVSNDPGREVEGCFDCTDTEYCLIISGAAGDKNHCAEAACGTECDCIIEDGGTRLEVCQTQYSCQDGSGLLYCFE